MVDQAWIECWCEGERRQCAYCGTHDAVCTDCNGTNYFLQDKDDHIIDQKIDRLYKKLQSECKSEIEILPILANRRLELGLAKWFFRGSDQFKDIPRSDKHFDEVRPSD